LETVKPVKFSIVSTKNGKGNKGYKPTVLAACLDSVLGEVPQTLLVAHGTSVKPVFEHVSVGAPGTEVVLKAEPGGALLAATQREDTIPEGKLENVTMLGPDNAADATISRPLLESGDVVSAVKKSKKKRQASVDLDADPQSIDTQPIKAVDGDAKPVQDDGDAKDMEEDDEETMEEKLIALGIVDKKPESTDKVVVPKADSVGVLLSQALQSDDVALLEKCLGIADEKVISNTVRKLRPAEAAKFLSACLVRLEKTPRRGLALVPWVRTVLLQHAATLMSNPAMQPVLSTLYQLIEARLSVFRPLMSLSGRLDLIMAQISSNEAAVPHDSDSAVVYEEEDSEVEVEEVDEDVSDEASSEDDGGSEAESKENGGEDNGEDDDEDLLD
jgi:U3 small nucleolar RNA-associated protein 5